MVPVVFFVLLFLTDGTSSKKVCSYQDVVDHLNLTTDSSLYKLTRPVLDHTHQTTVKLDLILYAILDVREKKQNFIPFVWSSMTWNNEFISWDPAQFCGITRVSVPKEKLWTPDLFILEMIKKDESPPKSYIDLSHDGTITFAEDINVVSTCIMDMHRFPFDTQRCNISIASPIYSVDEVRIIPYSNSTRATQFSREVLQTQGEWEFLQLAITSLNYSYDDRLFEQIVYTITIKRRPLLHVINFLLPILFFLLLDLASFFISDHRGEKLGFKVTVLLAISVLLLILNDILPSMSNRTPLIATYCIVIFALMLLSLLDTILVIYLMGIDSPERRKDNGEVARKRVEADACTAEKEIQTCWCICKVPDGENEHELLPVAEEVHERVLSREARVLLLVLEELRQLQNLLDLHLGPREEGGLCAHWATRINRVFFVFYVASVTLFLSFIVNEWIS